MGIAAKRILLVAGLCVACVPVAIALTIVLMPVWLRIEVHYGIEAVGHSGPADWCFWLVYALLVMTVVVALFVRSRRPTP
jgi:hypothetical protein